MKDGSQIKSVLGVANAHPNGNKPFQRKDYIHKFKILTENIIDQKESDRFLNNVQSLRELGKSDLHKLNIEVKSDLRNQSTFKKTILNSKLIIATYPQTSFTEAMYCNVPTILVVSPDAPIVIVSELSLIMLLPDVSCIVSTFKIAVIMLLVYPLQK